MFHTNLISKLLKCDSKYDECDDTVLIESPFVETTRTGKYLNPVIISLTPRKIMVRPSHTNNFFTQLDKSLLDYFYPLKTIELTVFKNSQRQCIKVSHITNTRYFELEQFSKRQIFWKIWCIHVAELNTDKRLWPFMQRHSSTRHTDIDEILSKKKKRTWTDKYLYLGSKRAIEDSNRPKPVAGLGPTEDIKLLYLKQKYFGCWDQSEHWVQCDSSFSPSSSK